MTKHEIDTLHQIELTAMEFTATLQNIKTSITDPDNIKIQSITINSMLKKLGTITLQLDSLSNLPMLS